MVDHLLLIHLGGVHQHRILRLPQGGYCPVPVSLIPLDDILQNLLHRGAVRLCGQFQIPAAGTLLRGGSQEDLQIRMRQHHRTNVPAVHNHVVLLGKLQL